MAEVSLSAGGTTHGNTVTLTTVKIMFQVFPGVKGTDDQRGIAGVPYTLSLDGGVSTVSGAAMKTSIDGGVTLFVPSNTPAILKIFDTEYAFSALSSIEAPATTKGAQRRLTLLGYELGGVDGSLGKKSDRAILNLQADSNLNADGSIDALMRSQLVSDFGE
ncbi:MAG: peptidoglycan-binding protein [Pyrinomonadaceae bacterium]|nr:peptidoglycan-binding protein [Pyrinomonadaceae bacterium]